MKKTRRILALIGVVLLAILYLSTLILALFDRSETLVFFKISIVGTIFIPAIIYAHLLISNALRRHSENDFSTKNEEE